MFVTGASMHLYPWNMEFQYISFIGWPLQAPAVSCAVVGPNIKPIPLLAGLMRTFLTPCFDWRWTRVFPHKPARCYSGEARGAPERQRRCSYVADMHLHFPSKRTDKISRVSKRKLRSTMGHHAKVDQLSIRRFAKRFGVFEATS